MKLCLFFQIFKFRLNSIFTNSQLLSLPLSFLNFVQILLSKVHNHLRPILQVAFIAKHSRNDFRETQKPAWTVEFLASFSFLFYFPSFRFSHFLSFCFLCFFLLLWFWSSVAIFLPRQLSSVSRLYARTESNRRASFFPIVADVPFSFLFAFDCHRFGCDFVSTTRTTIGRELATYFPFSVTSHRGHCF